MRLSYRYPWKDAEKVKLKKMKRIRTHPGEILFEEFMKPMNLSANSLALVLRIDANRINEISKSTRSITPDTALRLSIYFNTSPMFWLNLQMNHDLSKIEVEKSEELEQLIRPVA